MTLAEIKASPAMWLNVADIAPLLESDPDAIRCQQASGRVCVSGACAAPPAPSVSLAAC